MIMAAAAAATQEAELAAVAAVTAAQGPVAVDVAAIRDQMLSIPSKMLLTLHPGLNPCQYILTGAVGQRAYGVWVQAIILWRLTAI